MASSREGVESVCPLSPGAQEAFLALCCHLFPCLDTRVPECGSMSTLCLSPSSWHRVDDAKCLSDGRQTGREDHRQQESSLGAILRALPTPVQRLSSFVLRVGRTTGWYLTVP